MDKKKEQNIIHLAAEIRNKSLEMAYKAGKNGSHIGGALSLAEVFAVLYGGEVSVDPLHPEDENRDRVIVSKGHCVLSYYVALNKSGFITDKTLDEFETNGSLLQGHATRNLPLGIEFSGGSLGMGMSFSIGIALAGKINHKDYHVYVIVGDGECNEGMVWEAFMSASHFKLDNLTVIIDHNRLQYDGNLSSVMDMGSLKTKLEAFGFYAEEVDGHQVTELHQAFQTHIPDKPIAVIAYTIKGKGVSFMENKREWHHSVLSRDQYELAMSEQFYKQ